MRVRAYSRPADTLLFMIDLAAMDAALKQCEEAATRIVEHSEALAAARAARDEGLRALAAAGVAKTNTTAVVQQHLERRGWPPEKIAQVGLSLGTAKAATRPR